MSDIPMSSNLLPSADDVMQMQEKAKANSLDRLKELVSHNAKLTVAPEFVVEIGEPAEKILEVANTFKSDAIILGLHRKTRYS